MTAAEQLQKAQQGVCGAFFALAGAPDDPVAIAAADQALRDLDTLLAAHEGTPVPAGNI